MRKSEMCLLPPLSSSVSMWCSGLTLSSPSLIVLSTGSWGYVRRFPLVRVPVTDKVLPSSRPQRDG